MSEFTFHEGDRIGHFVHMNILITGVVTSVWGGELCGRFRLDFFQQSTLLWL